MERKNQTKWYIVRCQSNREKGIAERIRNEAEKGDLKDRVFEVLVPTEYSYYIKNGKKIKREKALYPGYIFVETNNTSAIKEYLKNVNGATGFLTSRDGTILPLSNREIENMMGAKEKAQDATLESGFVEGENVIITDGPFASMLATIDEINKVTEMVKVGVMIFGRKTPIDLKILQIKKVDD